jgi:regulator of sigma E protease
VLYQGAQLPAFEGEPVIVGSVTSQSVAEAAGLQPGDRIVAVDGKPIANWEDYSMEVLPKANRALTLQIERGGARIETVLTPRAEGRYESGEIGVMPIMRPEITATNSGEPAAEAGLKAADVIVAINGEREVSRDRVIELIRSHEGKPLTFEVMRDDKPVSVTVTPRRNGDAVRIGATISAYQVRTVEPGPIEALQLSASRNWEWTKMIVKTLGGLFTRDTSVKQLMGPVAIGQLSGDAAEQGWTQLFGLMAMISLNLGLLNLMPIPVLDGGHITILAMEGLSRRDFSMRVKEKMLLAGFVLLLTLMVTVIYNDLMRIEWIERLVPWR